MDNVFQISRFDKNTLIVGLGKQQDILDYKEAEAVHKVFQDAFPNINVVTTFGIEGLYMIKETL